MSLMESNNGGASRGAERSEPEASAVEWLAGVPHRSGYLIPSVSLTEVPERTRTPPRVPGPGKSGKSGCSPFT